MLGEQASASLGRLLVYLALLETFGCRSPAESWNIQVCEGMRFQYLASGMFKDIRDFTLNKP